MDSSNRPGTTTGKSYSEVMNEWAAQQDFVKGTRSRLLHPPHDAHPVAQIFGYMMRLGVVIFLPLIVFVLLLRNHGNSKEFNQMISNGVGATLNASTAKARGATWTLDGTLVVKALSATGEPGAFYEQLDARTIGMKMPVSKVFLRDWILPRVSIGSMSLALRSGGLGTVPLYDIEDEIELPSAGKPTPKPAKEGAATDSKNPSLPPPPQVSSLLAGYGISPDFKTIRINSIQAGRLNVTWGTSPSTAGSLTGMQTEMVRATTG